MNWLQARLKQLNRTHKDLQEALAKQGIERVRATITGWTGDKPISLLNDPEQTAILAQALDWTTTELLTAAGYDLAPTVPDELFEVFEKYQQLNPQQRALFNYAVNFSFEFSENFPGNSAPSPPKPPPPEPDDEPDDS